MIRAHPRPWQGDRMRELASLERSDGRVNRQERQEDAKIARASEQDKRVDHWANAVIGAAIEVHKSLGSRFFESVHEEALCLELCRRQIPCERQAAITVHYMRTTGW